MSKRYKTTMFDFELDYENKEVDVFIKNNGIEKFYKTITFTQIKELNRLITNNPTDKSEA